jgi:hypothetical protein
MKDVSFARAGKAAVNRPQSKRGATPDIFKLRAAPGLRLL